MMGSCGRMINFGKNNFHEKNIQLGRFGLWKDCAEI